MLAKKKHANATIKFRMFKCAVSVVVKIKVVTKRVRAYAFSLEPETKRARALVVVAHTIGNPLAASRSVCDI